jgi:hypothetical protein
MRRIAGWSMCALTVAALLSMFAPGVHAEAGDFAVSPQDCTINQIAPPQPGEVGNLATPSPTPTPLAAEGGTPADDAVVRAVTERIEITVACQNAGDVLRVLANFTERWVSDRFSGYDLVFYGRFLDAAANPEPLPDDQHVELISVDNVQVQDDGSVIASVTTRVQEADQTSLVVLVEESGTWLIDGGAIDSIKIDD